MCACMRVCICTRVHCAAICICVCEGVCVFFGVCHDLSFGNSCSGVVLITGWVLWAELSPLPLPLSAPLYSAILQGTPNDRVLLSSPLKTLSHSFPTHSPTTKEPSCCGADWEKAQTKLWWEKISVCAKWFMLKIIKRTISLFRPHWPCLFVYGCGEKCRPVFPVWKRKDTICFLTWPFWPDFAPCYIWKDFSAGLCCDWLSECTSLFSPGMLLSGVDNASEQHLDYATLTLCWI